MPARVDKTVTLVKSDHEGRHCYSQFGPIARTGPVWTYWGRHGGKRLSAKSSSQVTSCLRLGDVPVAAQWIVVIEAAVHYGLTPIDVQTVRRVMETMADAYPTTLYSPHRYALQVVVAAPGPADALMLAFTRWRLAMSDVGVTGWDLV